AEPAGDLERRSVHRLAGKVKKVEGERYYLLSDGRWAFHKDIGIALRPAKFPYLAKKGERWIEVDLSEQVLTLWEGTKPVFVTLVSTGRPAIGDPDKTNATPRGIYRIVTKHVTATMDSDQGAGRGLKPGDAGYVPQKGDGQYGKTLRRGHGTFKLRDVPYIQYFHKQFAIHGAYWHDVFGIARSHGCINLAPADALRVFKFTTPIPDGWHGANLDKGTAILIHK
ncbi:MAG: L,D-transpeptidase, partial [Myxococcota bacterium]